MMKVWGRRNSGNVIKVLWCLDELEMPFELEEVGGKFGKNREPWFLKMNPNGLVPVINDDGYIIWESNAVLRYLGAKYSPGQMWPEGVSSRGDADRWMDWPMLVQPYMTTLNVQLTRTPPEQRDQKQIDSACHAAAQIWAILDQHLVDKQYVGGPKFTIGDIAVGNLIYRWFNLNLNRPEMKHLRAWYDRLTERKPYQTQVMRPLA